CVRRFRVRRFRVRRFKSDGDGAGRADDGDDSASQEFRVAGVEFRSQEVGVAQASTVWETRRGRFMSTFLEHELSFHQNWMISAAMATQLLASSCFSAYFGSVADTWEKRSASNRVDILDGLTLAHLERTGSDKSLYGRERLYGAVSWGIAHILFGPLIDALGFRILYFTTVIAFCGCLFVFRIFASEVSNEGYERVESVADADFDTCRDPADQLSSPLGARIATRRSLVEKIEPLESNASLDSLDSSPERLSFASIAKILLRTAPVANTSYVIAMFTLFVGMYFEWLGGTSKMEGVTVIVTVIFELPIFHYASSVLRWLGNPGTMLQWASLAYITRVIGYSFIPKDHPNIVLLLEPLHGVTIGFATTSSVAFADELLPRGFEASGQGFLSTIKCFGQFTGLLIGGYLDGRVLYRVLAAIVGVGSLLLAIAPKCTSEKLIKLSRSGLSLNNLLDGTPA
ncbi:hypothetical protein THAOC_03288, partial [Thalassiosira oceanica]